MSMISLIMTVEHLNRIMTAVLYSKVDRGHPVKLLFSTSYTRLEYDF